MKLTYEFVDPAAFFVFFRENRNKVFVNDFDFDINSLLTDEEKGKIHHHKAVFEGVHKYYLVAKVNNEVIGWSFGMQKSADDYFMVNSAVFPEYRNKGIYSELLKQSIELIRNQGFQRVYSLHKMANNSILIPKLKFGFIITGIQINDVFGSLVELSYYTNPARRELLEIRIGTKKPNTDTLNLIQ